MAPVVIRSREVWLAAPSAASSAAPSRAPPSPTIACRREVPAPRPTRLRVEERSTILKKLGPVAQKPPADRSSLRRGSFRARSAPRMGLRGLGSCLRSSSAPDDGAQGQRRGVEAPMPEMRVGLGFLRLCLRVMTRRVFGYAEVLSCGSGVWFRPFGTPYRFPACGRKCVAGCVRSEHVSGRAIVLSARSPASAIRRREPVDARRRVCVDGYRVD